MLLTNIKVQILNKILANRNPHNTLIANHDQRGSFQEYKDDSIWKTKKSTNIIHHINKSCKNIMTLTIDREKAFNKMQYSFLIFKKVSKWALICTFLA